MPSGKTHDAITFFLAAPTFAASFIVTNDVSISAVVTAAMVFGGLMFGPDLDTHSKQYTRWSVFRFLWYPYQAFFAHRSRWSHGFVFGTFLRVVYFMGAMTLSSFFVAYVYTAFAGGAAPDLLEFAREWRQIGEFVRQNFGESVFLYTFVGLWLGAASHSITDVAGTFIKTGKL